LGHPVLLITTISRAPAALLLFLALAYIPVGQRASRKRMEEKRKWEGGRKNDEKK
jgi:hypothetical protein